jgi:hypothetical protein
LNPKLTVTTHCPTGAEFCEFKSSLPASLYPSIHKRTFLEWAEQAGLVPSQAQFEDVFGLDDEVRSPSLCCQIILESDDLLVLLQLLAMVSQPVKAVLLLFPITQALEDENKEEDTNIAKEGQSLIDPTIFWIKQTVRSFFSPFDESK